jgi:hypothetical protein
VADPVPPRATSIVEVPTKVAPLEEEYANPVIGRETKFEIVRLVEEALVRIALVLVNAGAVTKPDALILNTEDVEV